MGALNPLQAAHVTLLRILGGIEEADHTRTHTASHSPRHPGENLGGEYSRSSA